MGCAFRACLLRSGFLLRQACLLFAASASPCYATDLYDVVNNQLFVPLVKVGNTLYTGVIVALDLSTAVPGLPPPANSFDIFYPATNELLIPSVFVGPPLNRTFHNVSVRVDLSVPPFITGSSPASSSNPLLVLNDLLPAATVGEYYEVSVVAGVYPASTYTYMIDTLANGSGKLRPIIHFQFMISIKKLSLLV